MHRSAPVLFALVSLAACGSDPASTGESGSESETAGDEQSTASGEVGEDGDADAGDGDGDPGDGDGDGDPGDGDGDGDPGDGDGEPAVCGDGIIGGDEACDDGNADNTDACLDDCTAASCGDGFIWDGNEVCDDGNSLPDDGCSPGCMVESCTWDVDNLPLPVGVHVGNAFGEIVFDHGCDLIVSGAFTRSIYKVAGSDGSVSTLVQGVGATAITGLSLRLSDELVYVALDQPNSLWSLDTGTSDFQMVASLPASPNGVSVAPQSFGNYGDRLIWVSDGSDVYATNPADGMSTLIGNANDGPLSAIVFAPSGTAYTVAYASGIVYTVSADGMFSQFYDLPAEADGLAVSVDGTRLFVANFANGDGIDQLSLPGAMLTELINVTLDGGDNPSGLIADGAGHVLYKSRVANQAVIGSFGP